jgi:hypothetical protein
MTRWGAHLPPQPPSVGLVWSGVRSHDNDRNRSMRLATLAPLFDLPGIALRQLAARSA